MNWSMNWLRAVGATFVAVGMRMILDFSDITYFLFAIGIYLLYVEYK